MTDWGDTPPAQWDGRPREAGAHPTTGPTDYHDRVQVLVMGSLRGRVIGSR